jgi:peptide-methionine (S)-S-oxide reductase
MKSIKRIYFLLLVVLGIQFTACGAKSLSKAEQEDIAIEPKDTIGMSKAYFASGCFWCVEAIFESIEGVSEVVSGYAGGSAETANYRDVSSGSSKHAESVEVYYDPKIVSYETLLTVFFDSHDPTALNRQGPDFGFQYRSALFFTDSIQQTAAEAKIQELESTRKFPAPITTKVTALEKFYPAEDYHQNYERLNPDEPYVKGVSVPRLKKFLALHPELLKKAKH